MKTSNERKDAYGMINQAIIEKLESNTLPWKRSWNKFGPARNYVTKKPYRGINALLMNNTGSEYPMFLTFNQVRELGGQVRKGSKGCFVIFWKKLFYNNDGKVDPRHAGSYSGDDLKTIPLLRYYHVFNIDCVEGIEFDLPKLNLNLNPIETCEQIVAAMPNRPVIEHGGDQPSYHPIKDVIRIPLLANFSSEAEYYASLFHELSHSTAHRSRIDRKLSTNRLSIEYSFEELIAEISACFLCNEGGVADQILDNSASYIKGWLETLKNAIKQDEKFFVKASTAAQKAADYILNRKEESETCLDVEIVDTSMKGA